MVAQALLIVSSGLVWRFDLARPFPVVRLCLSVFEETMSVKTNGSIFHVSQLVSVIAPPLRAGP